jgi:DNA-binding transcriptional ArsR family regulator
MELRMPSEFVRSTDQELTELTAIFRLLSDKTRLNILWLLAEGERNVSSLCDQLKLPQPTVSHHLGLLRTSNIIDNRRAGKQVFYGLNGKVDAGNLQGVLIQLPGHEIRISRKTDHISVL